MSIEREKNKKEAAERVTYSNLAKALVKRSSQPISTAVAQLAPEMSSVVLTINNAGLEERREVAIPRWEDPSRPWGSLIDYSIWQLPIAVKASRRPVEVASKMCDRGIYTFIFNRLGKHAKR